MPIGRHKRRTVARDRLVLLVAHAELFTLSEDAKPFAGSNEIMLLLTSPHPYGMGLGANGIALEIRLRERFLQTGDWEEGDYEPAMQKVIEEGWVERVSDRVRLTEEGYQVICK